MKKIPLLLLFMSTFFFAQKVESLMQLNNLKLSEVENFIKSKNLKIPIDGCVDFINPDYNQRNSKYTQSTQRSPQNETQHVFNIYFHVINEDDGTREIAIGENEIMDAVALLNLNYNPLNIFFKYIGLNNINDSNWTTVPDSDSFQNLRTYAIDNNYYVNEAFNVFICEEFSLGAGIAFKPGTMSLIEDEDLLNSTLQHEIAHNFLIHHIHESSDSSFCEQVNSDNSTTAGDGVKDTNAAHSLDLNGVDNILGNADDEVIFSGGKYVYNNYNNNRVDCINDPYIDVQVLNYMASNSYLGIRNNFTNGQGVRMRETIENNLTTIYANVQNTVESLYKPYLRDLVAAPDWVVSTEDDPNNANNIIVCRGANARYKFQKGFDYEFYNVDYYSGDILTVNFDFSKTANDYVEDIGNKRAVKIKQLGNEILVFDYTNGHKGATICETEAVISGKVISTRNLGSYLINVENLNEQEITNPQLKQSLEKGTYYTIKKTTSSGVTTSSRIYKTE